MTFAEYNKELHKLGYKLTGGNYNQNLFLKFWKNLVITFGFFLKTRYLRFNIFGFRQKFLLFFELEKKKLNCKCLVRGAF